MAVLAASSGVDAEQRGLNLVVEIHSDQVKTIGIGLAIGLVLWPVVLPVVLVIGLLTLLQHGARPRHKPAPPGRQPEISFPTAVLDPMVRTQALAQVTRINTELLRVQLERNFRQGP